MLRCLLDQSVLRSCLTHALSTEGEEVVGLLLGSIDHDASDVHIHDSLILSRRDRRKDRVEIAFEDLSMASTVAELVATATRTDTKIVGWYHSHPHITVLPSAVDVRTQGQYQALDAGFIGLIFSVFDQGRIEVCAFQSMNAEQCWERLEVPITVVSRLPSYPDSLLALQVSLLSEELEMYARAVDPHAGHAPSATEVCAYAIHQILDREILPLKSAMRSRLQSLQARRDRLLQKLSERVINGDVQPPNTPSRPSNKDNLSSSPMLRVFPSWLGVYTSLKAAMTGFSVQSVSRYSDRNEPPIQIATNTQAKVLPLQVSFAERPPTPWRVEILNNTYGLISIESATELTETSLKVFCIDLYRSERETLVITVEVQHSTEIIPSLLALNRTLALHTWRTYTGG